MATLRAALKTLLTADSTLATLLPGGIFESDDIDTPNDGGWNWAPKSDSLTIQAHAIIRWGDEIPFAPYTISPEQGAVTVFCYHDSSYATLEQVITRVKTLLHNQYINADDRDLAHCSFAFASGEIPAEEYQRKPSRFIRFQINQVR